MAELDVSARRDLLVIAADGYGKRTPVAGIRLTGRGKLGVRVHDGPTPPAVALVVGDVDELLISTRRGKVIRLAAREVPRQGRRARGVRVVALGEQDAVAAACRVPGALR